MTKYVALVRAVNVGGTSKLPMAKLKSMCSDAGFTRVQTYIASGNVVFESRLSPARLKSDLERRLRDCCAHGFRNAGYSEGQPFSKGCPQSHVRDLSRRTAAARRNRARDRRKRRGNADRCP